MGAETTIYVHVGIIHRKWVKVSAVDLAQASDIARQEDPTVAYVLDATYDKPDDYKD